MIFLPRTLRERIAPAQARPFSDEQGYTIRNRRAENIRRNRRLTAEVYNPGVDEVSGLSTIGRAFALQSAKLTVRDLKAARAHFVADKRVHRRVCVPVSS